MTEWTLLLVPLLVLPIVALFRFVGCGISAVGQAEPTATAEMEPFRPGTSGGSSTATPPPPPATASAYRNHILVGKSDVLGYWRLVDPLGSFPSTFSPSDITDETYTRPDPAQYIKGGYNLNPVAPSGTPPSGTPGSTGTTPDFTYLQESLIYAERTSVACRRFDGGYVRVPGAGLYTDDFTIEAWIGADVGIFKTDYEYTLFDAYPMPRTGATVDRGFRVYVRGSRDPLSNAESGYWRVDLGNGVNVFPRVQVPVGDPTHIALTVKSDPRPTMPKGKLANLYVEGTLVNQNAPVPISSYTPPDPTTNLLIGLENIGTTTEVFRYPLICRVQEVVLHKRVLSTLEIEARVKLNAKPKA